MISGFVDSLQISRCDKSQPMEARKSFPSNSCAHVGKRSWTSGSNTSRFCVEPTIFRS
jgi:hypothetical protein